MDEISISEFKATCLELLRRVKKTGQPILITRNGEPIAQVGPPLRVSKKRNWIGSARGTGEIIGDIISPIGENDWEVLR